MYAYLNVYTNFPWEIKYGGRFDLCAILKSSQTVGMELCVEELSLKNTCLCRTLSYTDNDLHVNLGFK